MRRSRRRRRNRSPLILLVAIAVLAALVGVWLVGKGSSDSPGATSTTKARRSPVATPAKRVVHAPTRLAERVTGALPAALQDPAVAAIGGGRVLLLGGLTAADQSTDQILLANTRSARVIGHLPSARHDTAAVRLGRFAYVFGGGTASAQLDDIVRVDPASGSASLVAHLPAASSDSSAAAINSCVRNREAPFI